MPLNKETENKKLIIWIKHQIIQYKKCSTNNLFQAAAMSMAPQPCQWHHIVADKAYREKPRWELHKNATSYIEQILEATSHKTADVWPPSSHL